MIFRLSLIWYPIPFLQPNPFWRRNLILMKILILKRILCLTWCLIPLLIFLPSCWTPVLKLSLYLYRVSSRQADCSCFVLYSLPVDYHSFYLPLSPSSKDR